MNDQQTPASTDSVIHRAGHNLLRVLLLAIAYALAGKLGLLLAIPPGYATAIFPAAGVALAVMLLYGARLWPGVWLGSFLLNVWVALEHGNVNELVIVLTAVVALGATAQALAGAWLVGRFIGFPYALDRGRDVLLFMGLGGPVGCVLSASLGVAALRWTDTIGAMEAGFHWWTWWAGDTIGVLIAAPLTFIVMGEPRALWRPRWRTVGVPLAVALAAVILLFLWVSHADIARLRADFDQHTRGMAAAVLNRLNYNLDAVESVERFYASSTSVERDEFATFVQRSLTEQKGLQAIEWVARVPRSERAAFETAMQRDVRPDFMITERDASGSITPAQARAEYYPVTFIEPYTSNKSVLGYDLGSNQVRLAAIERARDSGKTTASERVRLVQERSEQWGILVLEPVYQRGTPRDTVATRRQYLSGFALGVFRMGDLVETALAGFQREGVAIELTDDSAEPGQSRLYIAGTADHSALAQRIGRHVSFPVADRQWSLHFTPSTAYFEARRTWFAWLVLAAGMLMTGLLGTFLLYMTGRAARVELLVMQRTGELQETTTRIRAIVENVVDGIVTINEQGIIESFNPAAERIFGYAAHEIIGRNVQLLIPEPYRSRHDDYLRNYVQTGEARIIGIGREVTGLRQNGETFPMDLAVNEMHLGQRRMFTGIVRDITGRKQAERQMLEVTALKQAILDSANYSIISTNPEGIIQTFNRAAERWLGYSADEVIGKTTPAVIHDPQEVVRRGQALTKELGKPVEPGFEAFVAKARLGMADENEWTYIRKDGSRFPVRLSVTALKDAEGRISGFLGIAGDISARKQAERERDRFFDMSLDMMCIIGFDGYIRHLNPAWERTLGYSPEELKSELFGKFIHRDDRERFMAEAEKLMQGGVTTYFESRHRCKDGSYRWMLWNASAYVEEKLIYAVARDITERKKIEQMQNEFVSTVSHELRTPLTSIRGSLGLIAGGVAGELPDKARKLVEIAHKNCERLVNLINDILDSEKIASGKMKFNIKTVDLMPLVRQAVEANQVYAAQHEAAIVIGDQLAGAQVLVDPDRLMQVFNNLLSNAAKFSPPDGEITVSVGRDRGSIRVSVSDQGPGIRPEFHDRIFQRFSQADSSDSRQKGGTGLGLSIAKAIVERMGGKIDFVSAPDKGTTFYFDLPELAARASVIAETHATRPRVLVVEDDADVATLLRLMLESGNLDVDLCYSAEQARERLARAKYDVMTVDIMLPGQDGIALIRELRADEQTRNIPIIVVSAKAEEDREAMNGSAFEIIDWQTKPIDQGRLLRAVRQASARAGHRKSCVLHIEDDPDVRHVVAGLLEDTAEVIGAGSLREARAALKYRRYDLVILDIGLPDGSGMEIVSDLKMINPAVPVMVFSASEFDRTTADSVTAALVKSRTSNRELVDMIRSLLLRPGIGEKTGMPPTGARRKSS